MYKYKDKDMTKRIKIILLSIIILGSFFLRTYQINQIPPSLNWDEVSIAYNAYSILKTGHDEWGQFLPLHFKAFGEYKLPAQVYASIPGIIIFGLNEFGVRITPIIYGTLTVLLLFLLVWKMFENYYVALLSAFLLATSPWHIQLTRASFESSFSVFWILLGFWLLVKGFQNSKWLILSAIPLSVSIYTYNSARVFTPLFLAIILFLYRKTWWKFRKAVLLASIIFIGLMLPLIPFYLSGEGNARYKLVSITDEAGLIPRINESRGFSQLPPLIAHLVHNKVSYISFYFVRNYLVHFTPQFLFISGASHTHHNVQGMGELFKFQAPFILIGLYFLIKKKNQWRWMIMAWLLLAIVPVATTNDSIPNALRTLIALPVYQILTALGLYYFIFLVKKRPKLLMVSLVIILGVALIEFGIYLNQYYNNYPLKYSRDWQYGYKQVVNYIQENQNKYDEIIFSRTYGEPHIFTLFFLNYDPGKYQTNPHLERFSSHDWVWVLSFDKFYFPDLGDPGTTYQDIIAQNPNKRLLFIGKSGDFPTEKNKLLTVNFLNGQPAFVVVENQ